jgi:hypothetical protein
VSHTEQHQGTSLSFSAQPCSPIQQCGGTSFRWMGRPFSRLFSDIVGRPSVSLFGAGRDVPSLPHLDVQWDIPFCIAWDVPRVPYQDNGMSHISPIQQECGTSLMSLTHYNGMSLQSPTAHGWDVPSIAHLAGWWDVPRSPYSVQWDVPAVSYRLQMGHPIYCPFSRMVGRPSGALPSGAVSDCIQMGRPSYCSFSRNVGRPSCPLLSTNGMSLQSPTTHGWDVPSIAHSAGWWEVPRSPYSVQWDVPAVSYRSQMGHPISCPFSRMVGCPSRALLSAMGCPCGLLPLTDGTSHLLLIQQDGGMSLVCFTQVNGMSLQSPTMYRRDVPPIAHSARWWDIPHVPYSAQWDVPAISYHSWMGHPSYCPFSRNVGRPSHRWDIPFHSLPLRGTSHVEIGGSHICELRLMDR